MGITECDNMLMLLSVSQKMNEKVSWDLCFRSLWRIIFGFTFLKLMQQCKFQYMNLFRCLLRFCMMYLQNRKVECEMVNFICTVLMFSQEREQVMPLMMKGFRDAAEEGGTSVTGGQTVINPWIIIGGVASVVCQPNDFIM